MLDLNSISPSNKAIEFITKRIADDKYRGNLSIQHTVYAMEKIINLLKSLDKFAPNKQLMKIRTTDLSKRPKNTSDEKIYATFVNEVSTQNNSDTQDTIRKNIFPDLHRMGLINRYNKQKQQIDPYKQTNVTYVSLTVQGLKLIKEENLLNQKFIWSKALDNILGGLINITLNILKDDNYTYENITKWEYMFFVSAVNLDSTFSFGINEKECIKLIYEFRKLSKFQQKAVIDTLRDNLKPQNYSGNKTSQRDFHNWRNKNDRIFEKFAQTVYFQISGINKDLETCMLSTKKIKTKAGKIIEIRKRSLIEKHEYYKQHKITNKISGFELHHIIALSFSESPEQYTMFDCWKNMVYIDAFNHAKITQNKNRNIVMKITNNDVILSDFKNNSIYLTNQRFIKYDTTKQSIMLNYNKQLLTTIWP